MSKTCIQISMPRTRCWPASARARPHLPHTGTLGAGKGSAGSSTASDVRARRGRPAQPARAAATLVANGQRVAVTFVRGST
jgi:hypothetical protein